MNENGNGSNGMVMPVQPMGGYGGNYGGGWGGGFGIPYGIPMLGGYGGGFGGGFSGDGGWLILLLILAMGNGGWGGFGGFGGWGGMMGLGMMDGLGGFGAFPWILASNANNQNATNAGFDSIQLGSQLSGLRSDVTSGFSDTQLGIAGINQNICQSTGQINNALCQGFAGTTAAVTAAQNGITQQLYNNEINSLNRSFAEQTANTGAINGVSSQLAKCCCDQELATANLSALVQRENCQDREALSNGIRDIITSQAAGVQRILDQMCNDKIDAKNERIAALENQVNMQALAASQTAQTAALIQDNNAQTRDLINRIAPYPQPSFLVGNPYYSYGYGWGNNGGCGNNFGNGFGFAG